MTAARDRVSEFVSELLRWATQVERVERQARGTASPMAGMLARVELYAVREHVAADGTVRRQMVAGAVIGRGVRGTHGAIEGAGFEEPAEPIHVNQALQARYDRLRGRERATADAIAEDGAGMMPVYRFFGAVGQLLTLEQRVGLLLADRAKLERWAVKLASKDPRPALEGSTREGRERIEQAAQAWWRPVEHGI